MENGSGWGLEVVKIHAYDIATGSKTLSLVEKAHQGLLRVRYV